MKKFSPLLLLSLVFAPSFLNAESAVLKTEFIYDSGPYPSVHATTIVETQTGLVAAWFGGTHEKHPDVGIWVSRFTDGRWSQSVEVANGVQYTLADGKVLRHPTWNPVLFQPKSGPLLLFYKAGPSPQSWWGMLTQSADGGKTWEQPRRLPEGSGLRQLPRGFERWFQAGRENRQGVGVDEGMLALLAETNGQCPVTRRSTCNAHGMYSVGVEHDPDDCT